MSNEITKKIKYCDECHDGDGGCVYPYYGLAPHIHTQPICGTVFTNDLHHENFSHNGDDSGVYTHCLNCGGDGSYE